MRTVPVRYLPWMMRDLAFSQGVVLLVLGVMTWLIMRSVGAPVSQGPGLEKAVLQQLSVLFLLYCSGAIVSNDRVHGYYRSYFSRPLSPAGYYLSRWTLGGLVFILMHPVIAGALMLAIGGFPFSWGLLVNLALSYLLIGGMVFFFSTWARGDWLLALLFVLMDGVLFSLKRAGATLSAFWEFVSTILPPAHLTSVTAPVPTGGHLGLVLLYGSALLLAGLVILRWRPLGAGGRA